MASPEHPLARDGTTGGLNLHGFLRRLRQRKLVQWALAYLTGAWLVLQLFGAVRESFGWSPALGRVLIALLVMGLFVALVLAWYHGEQGHQRVSGPELLMLAALFVIAGGVASLAGRRAAPDPPSSRTAANALAPQPAAARSIVVLPFTNLSANRENGYFSDGVAEDILIHLSRIAGLRVISRTSAMAYRESSKPLRQIAGELGVSHVVEGSVRRTGDRVRISVQLIDARTDGHLWGESYDRELKDVFQVQSEIARQIAGALQVRLSEGERERIATAPTANLTAYDHYLQGRQYFGRFTRADGERARALFRRAVTLDPDFALAYAWLARTWVVLPSVRDDSAETLSRKAIALDPNLADGYAALAEWHRGHGRFSLALEQYRRAVALNPSDATATAEIGQTYYDMGRLDESIPWLKHAVSLDPRTAWPYSFLGSGYELLGYPEEAERWYRRGLEMQPDFAELHSRLAFLYHRRGDLVTPGEHVRAAVAQDSVWVIVDGWLELFRGNLPVARERFESSLALLGTDEYHPTLGYIYWRLGEQEKAESLLRRVERAFRLRLAEGDEGSLPHFAFAIIHVTRGQEGLALRALDETVARGWNDVWLLSNHPGFAALRGERRFQEIVSRMRADVERQRLRVEREGL